MGKGEEGGERTLIATADPPAVDDGLPDEQLVVVDGAEALDALLAGRLGVGPCVELLEQTPHGTARRGSGWRGRRHDVVVEWARLRVAVVRLRRLRMLAAQAARSDTPMTGNLLGFGFWDSVCYQLAVLVSTCHRKNVALLPHEPR